MYEVKNNQQFQMWVEDNDLVVLKLRGDLLDKDMTEFKSTLELCSLTISHLFKDKNKKLKILLDASEFSGKYAAEAVQDLAAFAKSNTPYIDKTACFGVSTLIKVVGEVIIMLSLRDNIKIFNTKEDATAWLNEQVPVAQPTQ